MQDFDDEQIADEKSMCNLAGDYARLRPLYSSKVSINNTTVNGVDTNIWQDYRQLENILSNLVRSVGRQDYREYFEQLITQNQRELEQLVEFYPNLNAENTTNPIFRTRSRLSVACELRRYFLQEIKLIKALFALYGAETDSTRRGTIADFLNRRLDNLSILIAPNISTN